MRQENKEELLFQSRFKEDINFVTFELWKTYIERT